MGAHRHIYKPAKKELERQPKKGITFIFHLSSLLLISLVVLSSPRSDPLSSIPLTYVPFHTRPPSPPSLPPSLPPPTLPCMLHSQTSAQRQQCHRAREKHGGREGKTTSSSTSPTLSTIQPPRSSPHTTLKRRLQQRRVRMRSIPPHCVQQSHARVSRRGREGGRGGGREGGRELGAGGLTL